MYSKKEYFFNNKKTKIRWNGFYVKVYILKEVYRNKMIDQGEVVQRWMKEDSGIKLCLKIIGDLNLF